MTQISIPSLKRSSRFRDFASGFLSAAVLVMSVVVSLSIFAQA